MKKPRPSLRDLINNWSRGEGSFLQKLHLVKKNMLIKIRNRANCCGNYDEPGCCIDGKRCQIDRGHTH
ncbi:MAG: hypothetical protein OXH95_04320 [bacterium]|nr:hypothetical protein [bacterium]